MFRAYGEGRYGEALEVAREAWGHFPEKETRTAYWVACLLCRVGNPDQALRVLQGARGHWWGEALLRGDPDLEPLGGRPGFTALVEGCREAERRAKASARPAVLVLRPKGAGPHPLLLAFHARGGSAEECTPYFQPAQALGWAVALPQGTQLHGEGMYTWDDPDQAERGAAWAYNHVLRTGGGGKGASRACRGLPGRGARDPAGSRRDADPLPRLPRHRPGRRWLEEALGAAPGAARRGARGWILTGEKDFRMERVRDFRNQLVRSGVSCELEVVPGLGHEVPEGFQGRLAPALEFGAGR